jgi:pyrroline-5-carboxylate reductase
MLTQKGYTIMNRRPKTGFIGAGNMATALIRGLLQSGAYQKDQLAVSDAKVEALNSISSEFRLGCCPDNTHLVRECSVVILSVKPQNMRDVLTEVKDEFRDDHLIISIAAGIPLSMIRSIIGKDIAMIRVMPNTPSLVQKGASALAAGNAAKPEHMALARMIFDAVGETVEVEEQRMDAVTALSGSGPGYVFRIMESMVDAGIAVGLERDVSTRLVIQTFLGAAHLAKTSDHSLARLREMVTSPGGTTAQGLATLNRMGLDEMIQTAIVAARDRSIELGKEGG